MTNEANITTTPEETPVSSDGILNPEGHSIPSWRDGIGEEYRNHPSLKDYKDLNGLAKSHINLQSMLGRDKVPLPKEDAPKEEWDAFYSKLGRPEKPEDYGFSKPDGFPDGVAYDEAGAAEFAQFMHEQGLTKKQGAAIFEKYNAWASGKATRFAEEQALQQQEWENAIKAEWGAAFDQNVAIAQAGLKAVSPSGKLAGLLRETGMGSDPELVKELYAIGKLTQEDTAIGRASSTNGGYAMTPQEAANEKARLMTDKDFVRKMVSGTPQEQQWAASELARYNAFIHPEPVKKTGPL